MSLKVGLPFPRPELVLILTGADVQEISLAAIAWLCKSGGDGNENIYQRISQRLGEREQGKTFSRRIDHVCSTNSPIICVEIIS